MRTGEGKRGVKRSISEFTKETNCNRASTLYFSSPYQYVITRQNLQLMQEASEDGRLNGKLQEIKKILKQEKTFHKDSRGGLIHSSAETPMFHCQSWNKESMSDQCDSTNGSVVAGSTSEPSEYPKHIGRVTLQLHWVQVSWSNAGVPYLWQCLSFPHTDTNWPTFVYLKLRWWPLVGFLRFKFQLAKMFWGKWKAFSGV